MKVPMFYPAPVSRSSTGYWLHPLLKDSNALDGSIHEFVSTHPIFAGLELSAELMSVDGKPVLKDIQHFPQWDPQSPSGKGWFALSYGFDGDSFYVLWGRPWLSGDYQ